MALLPFYGAGYTHKEGPYTEQVNKGLYYLGTKMLITPQGGDLREGADRGGSYAQGLATIALCEAYAMSKDSNLRRTRRMRSISFSTAKTNTGAAGAIFRARLETRA